MKCTEILKKSINQKKKIHTILAPHILPRKQVEIF
jgi:hypothetical protein